MIAEKETFQESFHGARDTKMVIKRKAPSASPIFWKTVLLWTWHFYPSPFSGYLFFLSFFPPKKLWNLKNRWGLVATASATERFHSLKPKNLKGDKNCLQSIFASRYPCHLWHTGLSPWLPLALRHYWTPFPVFCISKYCNCHLDACISTEGVNEYVHALEEIVSCSKGESKQRINLVQGFSLPHH